LSLPRLSGASRQGSGPACEGAEPQGGHARAGEVGPRRSTDEPAEQRGAILRGGWGGEGAQAKENIVPSNTSPTQSGERVSRGLSGVRQAARERKQERFTALLHHLTAGLLRDSFYALKRQAAPGVDGVTWKEYETGLEARIIDLHNRVHRGAYQAQPSRRSIFRRQRPLGVATINANCPLSPVRLWDGLKSVTRSIPCRPALRSAQETAGSWCRHADPS
jgi:hypothetical protein